MDALVSKATAISASVQQRLPSHPSALRRIRAWSNFAAAARPVVIRVDHGRRSSWVSRTMYVAIFVLLLGFFTSRRTDTQAYVKLVLSRR